MTDQSIEILLAKQAIRDTLARYCRGLDRMDKEMAHSVFHQDSTVLYYDIYEGTGRGFIDWAWKSHSAMACHSHQIGNVLTEVNGDTAVSESYVTVVLWILPDEDNKQLEIISRGRYLDHWARRNKLWAIERRVFVADMQAMHELEHGQQGDSSKRDESDPSFALFTSLRVDS